MEKRAHVLEITWTQVEYWGEENSMKDKGKNPRQEVKRIKTIRKQSIKEREFQIMIKKHGSGGSKAMERPNDQMKAK